VSGDSRPTYESVHRRSAVALIGLPCTLVVAGLITVLAFRRSDDGTTLLLVVGAVSLATIAVIGVIGLSVMRVHRWTLEAEGLRIEERPKVRFGGFRRRTLVPFSDIAGMQNLQSGFDSDIEIAVRGGARHRLTRASHPTVLGASTNVASVEALVAALREAVERAGHALPTIREGLSFWNTPGGLAAQILLLATSVLIAGAGGWSFWIAPPARERTGYVMAILVLLPAGAGYLLYRSIKRRRAVLAAASARRIS
jgi:hypothetical protein